MRKLRKARCIICGKEFLTRSPNGKYCGATCRGIGKMRRKYGGPQHTCRPY